MTVEHGGRRDDIASLREQIHPLPFQAGDVQMRRQAEIEMRQAATGGAHGMGFEKVGIKGFELVKDDFGVEVEDDELADVTGDESQARKASGFEPLLMVTPGSAKVLEVCPRNSGNFSARSIRVANEGDDRIAEVEVGFSKG